MDYSGVLVRKTNNIVKQYYQPVLDVPIKNYKNVFYVSRTRLWLLYAFELIKAII